MKRSDINKAYNSASACFQKHSWCLPPKPQWDITDFGLQDFDNYGLVLINLAEEAEYCEKLMYAQQNQETPMHYHKVKKEDIICRNGELTIVACEPNFDHEKPRIIRIKKNGEMADYIEGSKLVLNPGERITIAPLMWHKFYASSAECIIGEVSTANDDANDNFFENAEIGRYPDIEEDEAPEIKLISEPGGGL